MSEFEVAGKTYRADRIPAKVQMHIVFRLAPLLGPIAEAVQGAAADKREAAVTSSIFGALGTLSDATADYVVFTLLRHAKRRIDGGLGWADVAVGEELNHVDIGLVEMMQIAAAVFKHNLADFMPALSRIFPAGLPKQSDQ